MKHRLKYPLIVEGKYDKAALCNLVEGDIFLTNGFRIYKNEEMLSLLRRLAEKSPVAVLTDSDRAGFAIRGHLAGVIPPDRLIQIYTPEIYGKERRKSAPSAEGKLGVEGMPPETLLEILERAGLLEGCGAPCPAAITKADLYRLGLSGGAGSAERRRALCRRLALPQGLSANALPAVLSRLVTPEELEALAAEL